ncbi:MAG: hypothetical protein AMJ46_05200 [Latescibacteria bacterium DG_63]|nr:MAG: hypothetical protein AMJ46_05200 [Latescibacteria bacterium DG_63]
MPGLGTWLAAFFTLCMLSFLYKDNPFFRVAESFFAGLSLGYYIGIVANQTLKPNLVLPLIQDFSANWNLVFAGGLGLMLYFRYIKKVAWVSRWALAVYVGYYVGVNMMQKLHGEVIPQVGDTMLSLSYSGIDTLWNVVMVAGVLSVLVYFYFSAEHKGAVGGISRLGIWFLMVSFGAAFGYTVMGRISLLIGRMVFLVNEWARPLIEAVI